MVMGSGDLRVFDPIYTTATITNHHGAAIYDTLFSLDSQFIPQPQKRCVSENKKTYTFELGDGLGWHDGMPVTAADCVASIRRRAQVASGDQLILERAKDISQKDISQKDDKTFTIALKERLGLLIDILATPLSLSPYMMRETDAKPPATEQVTANIGSGPFKFNDALAKPGVGYDRNEKCVPREEPSDGPPGAKIVNVDRVIWENITDEQTAFAAWPAGEIDFLGAPPVDFYSVLEGDPNLNLQILDKAGSNVYARLNFLQEPFDNVKARQAMLHLIDQEGFVRVTSPNPRYGPTVTSVFGNDTLYSNDENSGWYKKGGDPEKAKQLFREAGYAGEKIIILRRTNIAFLSHASQLLAAELRRIGVNAELAPSDWGGVVTRRTNKGPIENGGWNIFITSGSGFSRRDPVGNVFFLANGDKPWVGWPKSDEFEALRTKSADFDALETRQALARKMQNVWWDFVGSVMLGQTFWPIAGRKTLTGLIGMPSVVPMWKMQKA